MKKSIILSVILSFIILLSGCGSENNEDNNSGNTESNTQNGASQQLSIDISEMFTDRDMATDYDEEKAAFITLSGNTASCESDAVTIDNSDITITDEGTYIVSGTLTDGTIIINADDTDKIQIVLNGANISRSSYAAVYVLSADKVFITTAEGSENNLTSTGEYIQSDENNVDAVIFSKADLTLNGKGLLSIKADTGHGIVSKDDLVFTSGKYSVTAASHSFSGKDSIRIAGGEYTVISGKDGLHAENSDDENSGFLYISGGDFRITSEGDGISAGYYARIDGGEYTVTSGGGSSNASEKSDPMNPGGGFFASPSSGTDDSVSTKGIKAGVGLFINEGTFELDTADDSLHSNGDLSVSGGNISIASGDDGLHADAALTVSGGTINITESYEGIEGLSIDITGGNISIVSADDGINAAGGTDSSGFGGRGGDIFAATEGVYINISGGEIYINADGDGIDSNGDLTVSGGKICISGPTDGGNGSLDYNGTGTISGGVLMSAESFGMSQNFGTSSTQGVMMASVSSAQAGTTVTLYDNEGNELLSWQPEKQFSTVIISSPDIITGQSYTLSAGNYTTEITMTSTVYGNSSGGIGGGAPGGMQPGGGGGPGMRH